MLNIRNEVVTARIAFSKQETVGQYADPGKRHLQAKLHNQETSSKLAYWMQIFELGEIEGKELR